MSRKFWFVAGMTFWSAVGVGLASGSFLWAAATLSILLTLDVIRD